MTKRYGANDKFTFPARHNGGMRRIILLTAIAAALSLLAADRTRETKLQQAIELMGTKGDLPGAIKLLEDVAKSSDRNLAARSLLYLGDCRQKLGQEESRKPYERIIREFSDQKDVVAEARLRLAALGSPSAAAGARTRQVWTGPKVDVMGSVSPDGQYLSYDDWDTGDLVLHDFVAGTDRRLTNKGTWAKSVEFAQESAISRDGKQVAYAWYCTKGRYELRIASLQTSDFPQPRQLFDNEDVTWIAPYDWSPDGKWLVVNLKRKDDTAQIGLVSTQEGSLRVLKSEVGAATRMFFSPDGKYLGIDLPAGDKIGRNIFVLTVDGSGETEAVVGPSQNIMMGWSPDGKRLLFASDRRGSMDLWAIPMADGKPQGVPELVKPDVAPWSLGVTASGALFLGPTISDREIHVASLDFNTGKLLSPPLRPIQTFVGSNSQSDWSPDGKSLAYVLSRNRMGSDRVLAIRSLETGQVRELRPSLREFGWSRWAPDGRSFVCEGTDSNSRQGLYRIDVQTGEVAPIAFSPAGSPFLKPQWSPDGKRVYYGRKVLNNEFAIVERDLASGSEREVVRRKALGVPSVSPDGRYIAATSSSSLLLIPIAGGEPRELLGVTAPERFWSYVAWVPDGRGVIVLRRGGGYGPGELSLVLVGDGQPRKLEIDMRNFAGGAFSVHPDGRQIAYLAGEQKYEVWVLENFLPAAKAAK